ncbi:MAG: efflux RND transporter permease subunit [Duodenibacillus sp.]|nr:efflux RND transporter permease subunit [Duodenibacillus sp.]
MFSRFFIARPIFAWVVAIVIMLAGVLALNTLPVAQYPNIAPPQITINATYPGANAETMSRTVTQIIEQNMTGLDGFMYMSSTSDSTGRMTITLTFVAGTDPDIAQVQVQNKLSVVEAMLPETVRQLGIQVQKSMASFLMVVAFVDESGRLNSGDLGDFLKGTIQEPLARVPGVGEATVFGASYAMRIWLDPALLHKYSLQPSDVVAAVRMQNVQVAAGEIAGQPTGGKRMIAANVRATDLLNTPEQFEDIAVKTNADGSVVRVRDIATVELGQQTYTFKSKFNGKESSGMAISLAAGANALETSRMVRERVKELSPYFPEGVTAVFPVDTTRFVEAAMEEVIKTLFEAIALVVCVMYLFLQNWRATLIPTITVPVVLLGTFAVLGVMGFSINMLTMFGLVLAIGLLVDDAIIVVENVERVMATDHTDARTATIKSMDQISGALIGVAMVLSAVFVPMAFFGGSTGVIYRQFSVTVVSSMALSVLIALSLTPALCAQYLKPHVKGEKQSRLSFFLWFNKAFDMLTLGVRESARGLVKRLVRLLLVYAVLVGVVAWGFGKLPSAFMPSEDQGSLMALIQTPAGATAERTDAVLDRFQKAVSEQEKEGVDAIFMVRGFSFAGTGQSQAMGFIKLKEWEERERPDLSYEAIMMRSMGTLYSPAFKDALGFVFTLPPVPELGMADGFDFYIQDRAGQGHDRLVAMVNQFVAAANADPRLQAVRNNGMADTPMLQLIIDYPKARTLGVSDAAINDTINSAFGSAYVNDFMDRGRLKQVYVQGKDDSRGEIEDLFKWHVRNDEGKMVPLSAFVTTKWIYGPPRLARFNGIDAMNIQGMPAPGVSSGDAMNAVEEIMQTMPPGFSIEWNGVSYQERIAKGNAGALYGVSVLVVFLALAALYESWSIPFAVILMVPLGVLGAIGLTWLCGKQNDVYFQVGLLTTVGLVAKNAILIVEFARDMAEKEGVPVVDAVVEAVRLRLRPIVMTSLAFGLGVLPLAMATGAGAGAQSAIGVAVLGGMLSGTFLCIFFVPVFYVVIARIFGIKRQVPEKAATPNASEEVNHA